MRKLQLCDELDRSSCGNVLFNGYLPPPGTQQTLSTETTFSTIRETRVCVCVWESVCVWECVCVCVCVWLQPVLDSIRVVDLKISSNLQKTRSIPHIKSYESTSLLRLHKCYGLDKSMRCRFNISASIILMRVGYVQYVCVRAALFTVNAAPHKLLSFTRVEHLKLHLCVLLWGWVYYNVNSS